ncbi:DUF4232 domain-containing protein [Streptomyces sp. MST-110588]|uniref:DUF4232 domain-containing protein n=1 Tax=Streptomyces sp. MST-110588 TaxID=2833628 RepID=UPI00206C2757|nr:DUF4232 domain-containing protein [Streptomyces sp. MST-110588]UNO41052.1 DUF4232 domain-containing protein [Streptomyces sp. MST-110588]
MPRTAARPAAASRTGRQVRTLRVATAGLTAVAAAFTLTACGGQDPLQVADAKPFRPFTQSDPYDTSDSYDTSDPSAPYIPRSGAGTGTDTGTGTSGAARVSAGPGFGPGSGHPGTSHTPHTPRAPRATGTSRTACDATKVTVTAEPVPHTTGRLLLKATNTSATDCVLYAYPYLRFGGSLTPVAPLLDSRPQTAVTLAPGESGHAAVRTCSADGSGGDSRVTTSLRVALTARHRSVFAEVEGSTLPRPPRTVKVRLPEAASPTVPGGGTVRVDATARVTYWQRAANAATNW